MVSRSTSKKTAIRIAAILLLLMPAASQAAPSHFRTISNPDWFIQITDYGYADILIPTAPVMFREFLSGEWATALTYQGADRTTWLEPQFIFPDWTTNSDFGVLAPIAGPDLSGRFHSVIANDVFEITTTATTATRSASTATTSRKPVPCHRSSMPRAVRSATSPASPGRWTCVSSRSACSAAASR